MLTFTYLYRLYPDIPQQQLLVEWMDICHSCYNYGLRVSVTSEQ
ncbi:MAG: helix-turn-helix domain-containing protein [Xenococcaceae cyanobacterium]